MLFTLLGATLAVVQMQSTVAQDVGSKTRLSKSAEFPAKGTLEALGYPGATVLPSAHTDMTDAKRGNLVMILRTKDSVGKVSEFYEKNMLFPNADSFIEFLRSHPVTGNYHSVLPRYGMFYHRDVPGNVCHYTVMMGGGNFTSFTITAANGWTLIVVQKVFAPDPMTDSAKPPAKRR